MKPTQLKALLSGNRGETKMNSVLSSDIQLKSRQRADNQRMMDEYLAGGKQLDVQKVVARSNHNPAYRLNQKQRNELKKQGVAHVNP